MNLKTILNIPWYRCLLNQAASVLYEFAIGLFSIFKLGSSARAYSGSTNEFRESKFLIFVNVIKKLIYGLIIGFVAGLIGGRQRL